MKQIPLPHIKLRTVNHILSALIIAVCIYVIATPFMPEVTLRVKDTLNAQPVLVKAGADAQPNEYPGVNTLVIPAIQLQQVVNEGNTEAVLAKGIWRRPHTSSPDSGGNTVLAGHRFTYSDPAVFYHLDKVKTGDEIILYWNKQKYTYKVSSVKEVSPTATEVEAPSHEPTLTLYTCTPLWSSKYRLVVTANLIGAPK